MAATPEHRFRPGCRIIFERKEKSPPLSELLFAALERLQNRPEELVRARARFDRSPGASSSTPCSCTASTASIASTPEPWPEFDEAHEFERHFELLKSSPCHQFHYQANREHVRIIEQSIRSMDRRKETLPYDGGDLSDNAARNIMNNWIEQGIWNDTWTTDCVGVVWKHEEEPPATAPPLLCTREGEPVTEEQRATHAQEAAASRPHPQFLYQISKERKWLEDELSTSLNDIDQVAYQNVKESWVKQKIWNPEWTEMPGDTWMHERLGIDKTQSLFRTGAFQDMFPPCVEVILVGSDDNNMYQEMNSGLSLLSGAGPCTEHVPSRSEGQQAGEGEAGFNVDDGGSLVTMKPETLTHQLRLGPGSGNQDASTSPWSGRLRQCKRVDYNENAASLGMHQPSPDVTLPRQKKSNPDVAAHHDPEEGVSSGTTTFAIKVKKKSLQAKKHISRQTVEKTSSAGAGAPKTLAPKVRSDHGGRDSLRVTKRRRTDEATRFDPNSPASTLRSKRPQGLKKGQAK
ncbi:hypothetical protein Z517_02209 [Fonsecaea pedrosoi CBS 271.37]|uniref:Unplaced genomic scaffold supercont1.2, whole genome shotgun sequence n=1 Tax=Fonsecaea pedrosoi CBS 271.37 TaxID=1442368 RepID=A0A0D2DYY1_9EURO|nr:uncharacterized protein Z517_02209 [Fonsecaea pedrosoi CBS 271.37]KIW82966.1 hypothetical protein Z517_02209 [Fonsecaea pedrosoi CBS 271.37]